MVWRDRPVTYRALAAAQQAWRERLAGRAPAGAVVSLEADASPDAVAALLALVELGAVVVPLTSERPPARETLCAVAEVETRVQIGGDGGAVVVDTGTVAAHPLLRRLKAHGRPGLVLFSSGSTGLHKAAVHDFVPLLRKFETARRSLRALAFLLFDHIGGLNTLLYTLSNTGCLVVAGERTPDAVGEAIQRHRVELLPASPTFLRLLLLSEAYRRWDLTSLRLVTYGTEVMPEATLRRLHAALPGVDLLQTYGLSEVGILRSKSRAPDSLWVRVGGEGFETRVVDGLLEIRAESAMLGYLNAPSPITADGWLRTGDAVEVDGEWLRILGRQSDLINVGGEKVYPAEVEGVIEAMDGVAEATVTAEPNAITGHIVAARVRLTSGESLGEFTARMRRFCAGRLPRFKIPQRVALATEAAHGERFKKIRSGASGPARA